MANYFIQKNGQQLGPFTKEDLLTNGATKETFVWCNGMQKWEKAGDVQELAELFAETPPPFEAEKEDSKKSQVEGEPTEEQSTKKERKIWKVVLVIILLVAVAAPIAYNFLREANRTISIDNQKSREYNSPTYYLSSENGTYRCKNLRCSEYNLSGYIANSAEHTEYTNVKFKITFYKNGEEVESSYYTYSGKVPHLGGTEFSFSILSPKPGEEYTLGWHIIGADPIQW